MIKRKKKKSTKPFIDLGKIFKKAREDISETIAFISEEIKLPASTLKFIEGNKFDEIDADIYVRGYISSYAKYLNLNTKDILNIYSDNCNISESGKKIIKPEPFLKHKITKRHSKIFSLFITSIFFSFFSFAYFKAENRFVKSPVKKDNLEIIDPKKAQQQKIKKLQKESAPKPVILGGENMTDTERAIINNVLNNEAPAQDISADDIELSPFDPNETAKNNSSIEDETNITDSKYGILVITFKDKCWIKIKDASGKAVISKVFRKGKRLEVKVVLPISIKLARPEAIKTITFSKKDISLKDYKVSKRTYEIK